MAGSAERTVLSVLNEVHVLQDQMLRATDRFTDLSGIRRHLTRLHSSTGRPSVDPELMIQMLVAGCRIGIRSEQQLL